MLPKLVRKYREAYSGVPRNVWLISLVLLASRSGTMVLPFLSIYCTQEMGYAPQSVGVLLGVYGLGGVIAGIGGGWLTVRLGSIPTQLMSLGIGVPCYLLVGAADSFPALMMALFALSLSVECMRPACATATINFCSRDDQHTKAMAVNRLAVNLGTTIGPALGGVLTLISYDFLFYANSFSTFVALCLMVHFFGGQLRVADHPASLAGSTSGQPANPTRTSTTRARSPVKDGRMILFCALNVLAAIVFFQFMGTWPLYLKEFYGLQEYHIGLLFAVNTIVIVLFELVLVSAIRGHNLIRVFGQGHLLACLGFGMLPLALGSSLAAGFAFCAFSMLVVTIGEMLSMPTGPSWVARRSAPANRGRYMGLYVTSFSLASLVAPIGGMYLYQLHPDLVWYSCLIIGGIVFFGFSYLAGLEPGIDDEVAEMDSEELPASGAQLATGSLADSQSASR